MNTLQDVEDLERNPSAQWQNVYRSISLILAICFVIVGLIFLFVPGGVYGLFNSLSRTVGMVESNEHGDDFYRILAVGYMYVVSLLAFLMYRHPEDGQFLFLLINAKSASSVLSFLLFILVHPYLLCLCNGIVDGALACGLLILRAKSKGHQR